MLPASVLREGIGNITLTVGELGAWILKNRILNRVVATLPANKIEGSLALPLLFYIIFLFWWLLYAFIIQRAIWFGLNPRQR